MYWQTHNVTNGARSGIHCAGKVESISQARQYEIEEQLSKLLAMMTIVQEQLSKEHKTDLERLSRDHKVDLERVVSTQQEQAERQEELARCQETKWLQFMEKKTKDAKRSNKADGSQNYCAILTGGCLLNVCKAGSVLLRRDWKACRLHRRS